MDINNNLLISIIIPVYNGERFIEDCINSFLSQTYNNFELIIVNDGSTDSTLQIINKFNDKRINLINIENDGVSNARNIGIDNAKGNYVTFFDCDDYILTDALEKIVEIINNNQDIDIIKVNGKTENKDGQLKSLKLPDEYKNKVLNSSVDKDIIIKLLNTDINCYTHLLTFKNNGIIKFNTSLDYLEDKVFYLENMLKDNLKIYFSDLELYHYKYNVSSKTKNIDNFVDNISSLLRSHEETIKVVSKYSNNIDICVSSMIGLIIYRIEFLATITNYKTFKEKMLEIKKSSNYFDFINKNIYLHGRFLKLGQKLLLNKCYYLFYLISKFKNYIIK